MIDENKEKSFTRLIEREDSQYKIDNEVKLYNMESCSHLKLILCYTMHYICSLYYTDCHE